MMTDDMELVREYAAHQSEPAFETLVTRYVNLVYSTASRQVRDPLMAEEVAQAVFIILARKAGSLGPRTILPSWLHRTACYVAADAVKIQLRRARREQEAHMQSLLNEPQTDGSEVWPQIAPLLDTAIAGLNEKDRHAIVLRFFENKSLADVGQVLGANEDAARMRVNRALEKLRKSFTRRGIVSTTTIIAGAISANSVQVAPAVLAKSITAVAIAKGVAASGSTLTLIQGALKIMAWTKAKTALVASAAFLLTATTATVVTRQFWQAHPAQHGRLKLPTGNVIPMMGFGLSHGIILASDGSLWAWGEEQLGWPVLGLENIENTTSLRRIGDDTHWASVAVGDSHNLAVKSDGTLWAWGANFRNQLGDGTKNTRATPVPSIAGNNWKQAAAGATHSFALKKDGSLWGWGNNWAGQLGTGTVKDSPKAVQIGSASNCTKIWAGGIQTVGLQSDGSLWFWGSITGSTNDEDKVLVPTRVSPDTNWVDVCFGYFTVLAIKSDGTL
jgi:RNA polymerase sigma factor (sigma-70 family)